MNTAEAILNHLSKISSSDIGTTRLPLTEQHHEAIDYLQALMQEAGLKTHIDDAGTLIGRREGKSKKTLLMGSHQDSVPKGGAYDGIMGVVLPILALKEIKEELDFSIEILAFADEEGVRFPTALIGSRALAGRFDPDVLKFEDKTGITIKKAMQDFGLNPENIVNLARDKEDIIAFIEMHIEQGPVLENENLPLGYVSAICGIERHYIHITGKSGHAGTIPMNLRKDSLYAASKMITAAYEIATKYGFIATIGEIYNSPNAVNAISGETRLILEIRSECDETRSKGRALILAEFENIIEHLGLTWKHEFPYAQKASPCDDHIKKIQAQSLIKHVGKARLLPSGATHDASAMAELCPIGMFFVRCKEGISHTPDEYASPEDLDITVKTLIDFIKKL